MGQAIYTAAERAALKTPFADVVPPLSSEAYEALKSDIEQNKLTKAILVDELNNVLDGHHRLRACRELGIEIRTETCSGIGDEQDKRLRVIALNLTERQLSKDDRKRLSAEQKCAALKMLAEGRGVREVARVVGVHPSTVADWRDKAGVGSRQPSQPTATPQKSSPKTPHNQKKTRMTPEEQKRKALDLANSGIRPSDIATAVGVSFDTVKNWIGNPEAKPRKTGSSHSRKLNDSDVKRLFEDGLSAQEIASELGVERTTIGAYLKRMGLSRAGKRALNQLAEHTARAEAEAMSWAVASDGIVAFAMMATADQVSDLVKQLGNLAKAVATLKNRLNKEAGKDITENG